MFFIIIFVTTKQKQRDMKNLTVKAAGKMAGAIYTDCGVHIGAVTGFKATGKNGRNESTWKMKFFNGTEIDMSNYSFFKDIVKDAPHLYAVDNFNDAKDFTVVSI